jgi:protein disulfide-isomerase A1
MGTPFAYIFTDTSDTITEDFRTELEQLARKYRQKIQFSIAAAPSVQSIVLDMHLESSSLPAFGIREPISNLRYPMPSSTSASASDFSTAAAAFTEDYLADKLQPTIKSEPIPPPSPSALVKVVGQTYTSIVNDPTRDVLMVFCKEICAPCARLYPTLEALGEMYRSLEEGQEKTTVATILYDKNDTGLRGVRAYPTIMLYPAKDKGHPVRFLGDRTVERFRDFISANRSL